tara:strand:+ start:455 stop:1381 length:927 start_codon:yes stop_codon:yes gene_type:complete
MNTLLTIIFAFYCNDKFRRKYISACLLSLNEGLKSSKNNQIKILAIDGSPEEEAKKNKLVFDREITNVQCEYVFDQTEHPNIRIKNNLKKIKSKYVLRLLEDCVYRCNNFVENIINDCNTLDFLPKNSIIVHPFIDTETITVDGQTLSFPLPNIKNKKSIQVINNTRVYNRREDRPHFNFLTGSSVLYKYDFFFKHFEKFSQSGTNLYETDDDLFTFRFLPLFIQRRIPVRIRSEIIKIFLKEFSIQNSYVTESCINFNVIHIGVETISDESLFTEKSDLRLGKYSLHQLRKLRDFDWDKGFELKVIS